MTSVPLYLRQDQRLYILFKVQQQPEQVNTNHGLTLRNFIYLLWSLVCLERHLKLLVPTQSGREDLSPNFALTVMPDPTWTTKYDATRAEYRFAYVASTCPAWTGVAGLHYIVIRKWVVVHNCEKEKL